MKTKKPRYSTVSPLATAFGLAVTGAASSNPVTAPVAAPLGTATAGILGGVNLTDDEMNIKDKFDEAVNKTWDQIYDVYKLTDVCLSKLKQEVIGENTSTDEFVDNFQRKKLEESYALVIQAILEKHRGGLERKSKKTWDDEYIKNASKDIAYRLISTLQNVFNEDDLLKILKAIADRSTDIREDIDKSREANKLEHEQLMEMLSRISESIKAKCVYTDVPPALTTIPAAVNLIGRDNDIVAIIDLLERFNIVAIHADGGVGKTALAATIANQIKKDVASENSLYKHVAWITSTGNLKDDLIGLNIPSVVNAHSYEDKLQAASVFLQDTSTFLVIDNMDEPPTDDEVDLLNTIAAKTKILITSRADIPNADEICNLNVLDQESALVLFYRCFKRNRKISLEQIRQQNDVLFAMNIIEAAGCNALFIELMGKMAYADRLKLDSLWGKLKDNIFSQDSKYPIHTDHAKSHSIDKDKLLTQIQKLYEMSNLSDKQKEVMSFIALFSAEQSIFFDIFEWAGFEDDEVDNLGELERRGWIERGDEGYLIHTMVKGSVEQQRGNVFFDEDRYKKLIYNLGKTNQYLPSGMVYTEVRERIAIPGKICKLLANQGSKKKNTLALFNNIAVAYRNQGNYKEALEYCGKATVISEKLFGIEHPGTAATYNNLASVYAFHGNYDKALQYYEKALAIKEKVRGTEHIDTASTYNNMALVYYSQGNYDKAMGYYEKALIIYEKVLGTEDPNIATTYNNIGNVYYGLVNYNEALKNFEKALAIREKVLGVEHPSTAATYDNIAKVYFNQENYDEALKYFNMSLAIREKVLGTEHPETAGTYYNMGNFFYRLHDYEKAKNYYERALAIYKIVLGLDHPYTKRTKRHLEDVNKELGK